VLIVADVGAPSPDAKFVEVADRTILSVSHDLKVEKSAL
jgi:hypothetical protein